MRGTSVRLALCLAVVLLIGSWATVASAATYDGTIAIRPGDTKSTGLTKVTAWFSGEENSPRLTFYVHNANTRFYYVTKVNGDGTNVTKRVGRNAFVRYVNTRGAAAWFSWTWKTNAAGKKYRYINKITASAFAG